MSKYSIKGFVARDKDGVLFYHSVKPKRYKTNTSDGDTVEYWIDGGYRFMIPDDMHAFMNLKWEDEPVETTLSLEG